MKLFWTVFGGSLAAILVAALIISLIHNAQVRREQEEQDREARAAEEADSRKSLDDMAKARHAEAERDEAEGAELHQRAVEEAAELKARQAALVRALTPGSGTDAGSGKTGP